jgi:hypothetical protein
MDVAPLNELKLETTSTAFWKDRVGFYCGSHADNVLLEAAMQVYLDNSADPTMGTRFHPNYTVAYRKNTGYLMINCGQLHGATVQCKKCVTAPIHG